MGKTTFLSIVVSLFMTFGLLAQEHQIPVGRVAGPFPVGDSLDSSFEIYLPTQFNSGKKWPVIFVFDPEGRGRAVTQLFRSVAEEQSYIIVASNDDLRKNSLQANLNKASNLMNSVLGSLPIDLNQVYSAGMNEGGQVALAVPLAYNKIKGVISVGEAWLNTDFIVKDNPFIFIGLVNEKDPRMYELQEIEKFLKKVDFPARLSYFDGEKGDWPTETVISNAVTSLTLRALETRLRKEDDPALLEKLYRNEMDFAQMLRRKGNYYDSYQKLEEMEERFDDSPYEDEVKEATKDLRRNDQFRDQRRDLNRAEAEASEKKEMYKLYLTYDITENNFENVGWWAYQMDELHKLQKSGNLAQQRMGYTLEGYLKALTKISYNNIQETSSNIDTKILISVLRTVVAKDDPEAYLNIIQLAGHDGDFNTALLYLEDLLKTGFDDMDALYDIPGILDLKFSKEYNELIEKYLGDSKYYRVED